MSKGQVKQVQVQLDKKREIFENLCRIHCSVPEVCAVLGCSDETLQTWCKNTYQDENGKSLTFEKVKHIFEADGKVSLRRAQWKSAESGNTTMLVWLGKQWLGQTDKVETGTTERIIVESDISVESEEEKCD